MSLIKLCIELYSTLLIVRFFLQLSDTPVDNPLGRGLLLLTERPIRFVAMLVKPGNDRFNWTVFTMVLALQIIVMMLVTQSYHETPISYVGIFVLSLAKMLYLSCTIYVYSIVADVILSWVVMFTGRFLLIKQMLMVFTSPLLAPIRRVIPNIGPLDLSPMIAFFGLNLLNNYVVASMMAQGLKWLLGQ